MKSAIWVLALLFLVSCGTTTRYYIVRHGEKEASASMSGDVPLSAEGTRRAADLSLTLNNRDIRFLFTTNYHRTRATLAPLATALGLTPEVYDPRDTTFVEKLKRIGRGDVVVVGHSNTVDDVVNGLTGQKLLSDLPDTQYGDLFIIKRKGSKFSFERDHFGKQP